EFMSTMLGQEFEGLVSGVTEWGIFVEIIETKCEGMIRLAELNDDYYEFDEKSFRIIGRNNKRIITLGDKLTVKVVKTDIDRRTIDLDLVTER
ncbi:MAG: S1 RNA-binding domain-containing protein, partial [Bacteroidetes bacterium]|nr:S1 RNA-binding domain-containing protein [Bacteroidota bacterium]